MINENERQQQACVSWQLGMLWAVCCLLNKWSLLQEISGGCSNIQRRPSLLNGAPRSWLGNFFSLLLEGEEPPLPDPEGAVSLLHVNLRWGPTVW